MADPSPSQALLELENISALVHHHKQIGCDEDCKVSIIFVKQTAERLRQWVRIDEMAHARAILDNWPY